ncbi:RERG/RAS-like b [Heterodontus francisci]|uniref:RERG/RAS-like b n=1 Tax=Heterodontus francisci TaxID=7792 RepID=UPI00355B8442
MGTVNEIKIALLGSEGVGKSALLVRFLTKRFIGEYASNSIFLYKKRLLIDGRQLNLEIFEPCSQTDENQYPVIEPLEWANSFIVVYNISDRASFLTAKNIIHQIKEARMEQCKSDAEVVISLVGNKQDLCHAREVSEEEGRLLAIDKKCQFQEVSAAEHYQEIFSMFLKLIHAAGDCLKNKADKRRYSGSKSMAKFINNVFGKRRKSV